MRGLALEGGGARGAYHIGVVKAYLENGYEFDGFVGTSIGAINAAILAQGDFDKALELWPNISMEQIFDEEEQHVLQLMDRSELKRDTKLPSNMKKALAKIIEGRGVNTSKMKTFLESYINEERVRGSGKDFGLVTISVNERKPYELMLEDIPQGSLVNYIMASASFPGFRPETIDEKVFLDGGFYNKCPVNLLADRGYDEIIAVRSAPGPLRKIDSEAKITVISPRESLGSILLFTAKNSEVNIKLGYYDGLRSIKNLRGATYYINPVRLEDFYTLLTSLEDNAILDVGKALNIPAMPAMRMLFEHIVPQLGAYLKLSKDFDYADFVISLLEYSAQQKGIEQYQVYDYLEFCFLVKNTIAPKKEKAIVEKLPGSNLLNRKKIASELLIEHLLNNLQMSIQEVIA